MQNRVFFVSTFILGLALVFVAPACHHAPGARAARTEVGIDHAVLVRVLRVDGEIFKFNVANLSDQSMLVDRDAITLATSAGPRKRESGGMGSTYTISPGGAHDVFVKFSLSELEPGSQVSVDFGRAIRIAGQPVALDAIPFTLP
jgi:hypothetical protein